MSLDEDSYTGGTMGAGHPAAWRHNHDGGRPRYTAGGHTSESFAEPAFLEHVYQGLRTAAGAEWADCSASLSDAYELVQLDNETNNPMSLEVAPDGTVFYIDRAGRVERIDAATQQSSTAL